MRDSALSTFVNTVTKVLKHYDSQCENRVFLFVHFLFVGCIIYAPGA